METDIFYLPTISPVFSTTLGITKEERQIYINEVYRLGDSQNQQTNVKALMSSYAIYNETPIFNPLLDIIIHKSVYLTNKHVYPHLGKGGEINLILSNAWGAIYKKGHYTIDHEHEPCDWSFIYYLKSSGQTPLVFTESRRKFFVKDDNFILFKSDMVHRVPKHNEEEDRICIAGNFIIKNN